MSVKSKIKSIVQTYYPDATFVFQSWFNSNIESFDISEMTVSKPLIVFYNKISEDVEMQQNMNIVSEQNIRIRILAKTTQDQTDEYINDNFIEPLKIIANKIMINLFYDVEIKGSFNPKWRFGDPLLKIYNSILSGVEVTSNVKLQQVITCVEETEE